MPTFDEFFRDGTGHEPYPYQRALGTEGDLPSMLAVPTGLGKTAAVLMAWLWRRRFAAAKERERTPRRLVYCLPMRTLVEQTDRVAREVLSRLEARGHLGRGEVDVDVLLGGAADDGWAARPEHDGIIVGTQDMLLSRALNRGYGMSRYLWPIHFGWLNSDALWVMDETQLMGVGLTTSVQLQGLREKLGTTAPVRTLWMSATLEDSALATVDHAAPAATARVSLTAAEQELPLVAQRVRARKLLARMPLPLDKKGGAYASAVAKAVLERHQEGTLTLVVMNRVERARQVYEALAVLGRGAPLALLHSRFRPGDRQQPMAVLLGAGDRIVVSTQVVEAGVDVSARTLVTEIAPWASLVQRFGRCNRGGEFEAADVVVIDPEVADPKLHLPYSEAAIIEGGELLGQAGEDVGPASVSRFVARPSEDVVAVLRRRDLVDLFDTTPDLAGNDLDVSRFIRESDDHDVEVYWRAFDEKPTDDDAVPAREEICRVSVWSLKAFLEKKGTRAFRWSAYDGEWQALRKQEPPRPGQRILLPIDAGGYSATLGWTGEPKDLPPPLTVAPANGLETLDDEHRSFIGRWLSLKTHSSDVRRHVDALLHGLGSLAETLPRDALLDAGLWHDLGKAHPAFQEAIGRPSDDLSPQAKSPHGGRPRYRVPLAPTAGGVVRYQERPGFRHELASALAWLTHQPDHAARDLVAYLIAAHHGKVRLSIRALPNENEPDETGRRFARGVWEGDLLPSAELSDQLRVPETPLSLCLMELGRGESGPSWTERVLGLRELYGPFRLAYFEGLVRIADWRASAGEGAP